MTAKLSSKVKTQLNRMNRAAQNAQLGTMLQNMAPMSSGSWTVTAAQMNASLVEVPTGLTTVAGFMVQGFRSGSPLAVKAISGSVAGAIVVLNSTIVTTVTGGSVVATGDVINYVAFQ
jgi:hypothetical protein